VSSHSHRAVVEGCLTCYEKSHLSPFRGFSATMGAIMGGAGGDLEQALFGVLWPPCPRAQA
jgi:hypothetical protein